MQTRKDLVPNEIAGQAAVGIAFVLYPLKPFATSISLNLVTTRIQQWAKDSQVTPGAFLRHGGKTNQASTSQQVEQHGLRLISTVLRQEYSIELQSGKSAIACISCSRFETITLRAINADMANRQVNPQRVTKILTKNRPAIP